MPKPISPNEMQEAIKQLLRQEPCIGLRKAVMNMLLEPRNPFDLRVRRKPKPAVLLCVLLFAAAVVCFCCFSFNL